MSERDRITASALAADDLPVRDCCGGGDESSEKCVGTSPILTDSPSTLVQARLAKSELKTHAKRTDNLPLVPFRRYQALSPISEVRNLSILPVTRICRLGIESDHIALGRPIAYHF